MFAVQVRLPGPYFHHCATTPSFYHHCSIPPHPTTMDYVSRSTDLPNLSNKNVDHEIGPAGLNYTVLELQVRFQFPAPSTTFSDIPGHPQGKRFRTRSMAQTDYVSSFPSSSTATVTALSRSLCSRFRMCTRTGAMTTLMLRAWPVGG